MLLQKGKNYPKITSFLLSAENPEHALKPVRKSGAMNQG
jgi:hypothetical protein